MTMAEHKSHHTMTQISQCPGQYFYQYSINLIFPCFNKWSSADKFNWSFFSWDSVNLLFWGGLNRFWYFWAIGHRNKKTLFQFYTLHPTNLTLFPSYTLPILHSSSLKLFQSHTLPISHSSNPTLFQVYTIPILHSITDLGRKKLWIICHILYFTY